ncbi:MAG TPA: hypothetical protein PKD45_13385 [Flavobacteriales bacterium]|nr:hypothetical protein [Flavobacteriales bacterium]
MLKLFTLFNLAGLLLFNFFFAGDISITQDLPARMDPGSEVRVTVTVNKGTISGFAKLQIDLPPGFSATAIDTRGASFTYADGKAKFIWMALPTQASFKVSYTLSADASTNGNFPVTARLSYIQDNERKTADMAPATIAVGSGGAVAQSPAKTQETDAAQPQDAAVSPVAEVAAPNTYDLASAAPAGIIPDAPVTDTPGLPAQKGPGNVVASRTVTQVGNSELLVEVTIQKGGLRGFGKLQENLPQGFSAVEKNNDDAIFSMQGRVLKYVWLNMPAKNELKISYRLLAPDNATGTYTINGEFGYLLDDLTQRAVVGSSSFTMDGNVAAQEEQPTKTVKPHEEVVAETVKTTEPTTTEVVKPTATTEAAATTTRTAAPKVTNIPAPETGIAFKVQITAAHREVGKAYFMERHKFGGDFSIEHHEGWIKYVTGNFDRYRAARDQRQAFIDAQHNFPGPFVTAYNNGERITVQEALMIAKQTWVP